MLQTVAVLLGILLLSTIVAASESDYRKYLRTRPPQLPGEVHVEEVLEVFKSKSRPPPFGVYNAEVNAFLANEFLQKRRRSTSTTSTTSTTTTTTTTTTEANPPRSTYPSPSRDNINPDYTDLFKPSISMTKYPSYVPPKKMIIIKEGEPTVGNGKLQPSAQLERTSEAQADVFQYSNEEDYLDPLGGE
ncbi:uncharacterized protein LOC135712294 [Ochlerotatus camptorhynchus]|uniref:uncharacterized protein LOC135712294 n=1 Tax=Ochlerotatus camptorhynchus TaxID=644619 RepID=UPI0031E3859A